MNPDTLQALVTTEWLDDHLQDADLRVFDCSVSLVPVDGGMRPQSGRADWEAGHIPGSGFADLLADLADRDTRLPLMMPPPGQFAEALGRYGVGPGARVVLYDRGGHQWATRVWWMLRAMGFETVSVLDGGWPKWRAEGRAVSLEAARYPVAVFPAVQRPGVFAGKQVVFAAMVQGGVCLINALSADEHTGRISRTPRPGRIPGSVNVPAMSLVDPVTAAYLPLEALREQFDAVGALDGRRVISYCGGGIAATSVAFTLLRLGVPEVGVYDGSLVEWSADASLPMETG